MRREGIPEIGKKDQFSGCPDCLLASAVVRGYTDDGYQKERKEKALYPRLIITRH